MSIQQTSPSRGSNSPDVTGFYEPDTGSIQYVVSDPATKRAAIVDAVWNFNPRSGRTSTRSADELLQHVRDRGFTVEWILDTHPHADHLMAAAYLKAALGAPQAIGEKVRDIARLWSNLYNSPDAFDVDTAFDRLFSDGDTFQLGSLPVCVMLSPGHTLGSMTFVIGSDAALVHDTLMYPDSGTSRADFPGGDARELYRSIARILSLPDSTRLFVGHDYCPNGREPKWEATVGEQKASNIHVKQGTSESDYVKLRTGRDRTLPLPDRILHALQINLRGGRLPGPEDDGHSYLKFPINRL